MLGQLRKNFHNRDRYTVLRLYKQYNSVGDPDPKDPHVFLGLPIRLRILPFSHKCVERTEKMLDKIEI